MYLHVHAVPILSYPYARLVHMRCTYNCQGVYPCLSWLSHMLIPLFWLPGLWSLLTLMYILLCKPWLDVNGYLLKHAMLCLRFCPMNAIFLYLFHLLWVILPLSVPCFISYGRFMCLHAAANPLSNHLCAIHVYMPHSADLYIYGQPLSTYPKVSAFDFCFIYEHSCLLQTYSCMVIMPYHLVCILPILVPYWMHASLLLPLLGYLILLHTFLISQIKSIA